MISKHGIIWDILLCFTEWNFTAMPKNNEAFFTYLWSTLGVVGKGGSGVTKFSLLWNLFQQTNEGDSGAPAIWALSNVRYPWDGEIRGDSFQMVCQLTQGMRFATRNPIRNWNGTRAGTGEYTLTGAGRKAWIWHNVNVNWTTKYSTSYTVSGISASAKRLEIYRYNSWSQSGGGQGIPMPYRTQVLNNQTSFTFNSLPQGETLFFLASDGITSGSTYKVVARNSGRVLEVNGNSAANGANVQQWTDYGGNGQRWIITDMGGGSYKLLHKGTNQALEVAGWSTVDGGNVQQWQDGGGANQRWSITAEPGDLFRLTNKYSGKVLDVNGGEGATSDGANVHQWSWGNNSNQVWRLERQ